MMTRKQLRLLAYVRVSDVRGREGPGFISPTEQLEKTRAFAAAMGHTIVAEAEELDRSGGDMSRPVFNGLLERIEAGEADGMIVAKLNRFARSNVGAWQALERIKQAGGELLSVEENIDTSTATGRFLRDFMLIAANWERERIGEQWLSARTRAVNRGIHISRYVPPGYRRLPKSTDPATDRRLEPDPVHGPAVAEAFAMAARGESFSVVAAHLNANHVPIAGNKNGDSVWLPNRIKRFLANRVYLGEARSGDGIANADAHEPLVDAATWTLAQRRPTSRKPSDRATTLLAGICRCAGCFYAMRSQAARGSTVAAYRCTTTSVHGRCPSPSTVSLTRLDEYVLEQFLAHAGEVRLEQIATADDSIGELAKTAAEAEQSYRQALTDIDLRQTIGAADHGRMVAALHEAWQRALAEIPDAPAQSGSLAGVDVAGLVAELQRRGDVASLRELLASDIQAVFVRPAASRARNLPIGDRVHIVWQNEEPLELPRRGERFEPRPYVWS